MFSPCCERLVSLARRAAYAFGGQQVFKTINACLGRQAIKPRDASLGRPHGRLWARLYLGEPDLRMLVLMPPLTQVVTQQYNQPNRQN